MKKSLLTIGAVFMASAAALAQNPGDLDVNFGIGGYAITDPFMNTGESYWNLITLNDDKIIKVGLTDGGADTDILVGKFLADGTPDSSFAVNGFAVIDLSMGGSEDARGVYELPSGKLLITGYVQGPGMLNGYVMQLNADGTIDLSFGINGVTQFNAGDNLICYGKDVVAMGGEIYVGGSVLVGGQSDICVFNFTATGVLDVSFASGGSGIMDINGEADEVTSMAVTSGGAFILGGISDSVGVQHGFVASLSQFGIATTFGGNGSYTFDMGSGLNEVNDVIVDANGNIVVVGDEGVFPNVNGFIMRLDNNGAIDNTFGTNGIAMSDPGATTALFLRSVNETADGGFVAVGNFDGTSQDIYALLVTANGSFNSNFGGNGDVIIPFAIVTNTVAVMGGALQSDGSIIIGGYLTSQDFVGANMFMVRLFPYDNTSVSELTKETVNVYPNPALDKFTIQMEDVQNVQMISMQGEVVGSWSSQMSYDVPQGVTPGIYLLKIESANAIGVARISIK